MILSCDTPWFYNTIKLGKSRPNGIIMLSKSQVTQFHQSFKQLNIIAKKKKKKLLKATILNN